MDESAIRRGKWQLQNVVTFLGIPENGSKKLSVSYISPISYWKCVNLRQFILNP